MARRGDSRMRSLSDWQRNKKLELSRSADAIVAELRAGGRLFPQEQLELNYEWGDGTTKADVKVDPEAVTELIRKSVIEKDTQTGELRLKIPLFSYSVKTPKKTRKPAMSKRSNKRF
jgi:hypothetical protein